jgi:hypothetical protein
VYLEDYEAIYAILGQSPHWETLVVEVQEHGDREWLRVDQPEDLRDPGLALTGIRFSLSVYELPQDEPAKETATFVVQFDAQSAYVLNPFKDVLHDGITQQIADIAQKRRRRRKRFVFVHETAFGTEAVSGLAATSTTELIAGLTAVACGLGIAAGTGLALRLAGHDASPDEWLTKPWPWVLGCVIAVLAVVLLAALGTTVRTRLHTLTRAESPKFLERNRDEIIVSAGSTFAGFLLGVGTTLWLA